MRLELHNSRDLEGIPFERFTVTGNQDGFLSFTHCGNDRHGKSTIWLYYCRTVIYEYSIPQSGFVVSSFDSPGFRLGLFRLCVGCGVWGWGGLVARLALAEGY